MTTCSTPTPSHRTHRCLFEVKHDDFRALAHVEGHHSIRAYDAVLDGEIVCLDADGRSNFYRLFRRDWPYFFALDLLSVDGEDLTARPLVERKRRLRRIVPRVESRLLYVDHVQARGVDLFRKACRRDLEGVVAKWKQQTIKELVVV